MSVKFYELPSHTNPQSSCVDRIPFFCCAYSRSTLLPHSTNISYTLGLKTSKSTSLFIVHAAGFPTLPRECPFSCTIFSFDLSNSPIIFSWKIVWYWITFFYHRSKYYQTNSMHWEYYCIEGMGDGLLIDTKKGMAISKMMTLKCDKNK